MKNNNFINISRSISYNCQKRGAQSNKIYKNIPYIWFFTDSNKTLNPLKTASKLPNNAGIIIRSYSSYNKDKLIDKIIKIKKRKLYTVLIAGKSRKNLGADGIHIPQWVNSMNKNKKIVSMSAHGGTDIRKSINLKADIIFISPVFKSSSHKKNQYLGVVKLGLMAKLFKKPIIALGGINNENINRLKSLPIAGCAGIDIFINNLR